MLGWLAAAAAPILIHLWMRQTRRETVWAALRFLQAALERQARRLRLQHWILLAIRTLLLLCVALAAAKPFLDRGGVLADFGAGTHHVLVFDTSLSMGLVSEQQSRLNRAQQVSERLVGQAGGNDRFSILAMSGDPRIVLTESADKAAVRRAIEGLIPTAGVAAPGKAMALVSKLLNLGSDVDQPAQTADGAVRVLFLTDLDEAAWQGAADTAGPEREALQRLAKVAELAVVDTAEPALVGNASLETLRYEPTLPTIAGPIAITGEARLNRASEPFATVAELVVKNEVVATQAVTLRAGTTTPVSFSYRFIDAGDTAVAIRLREENLLADNARWAVVPVRERVRVLCVEGARDAARYLQAALEPTDKTDKPIVIERIADADLSRTDLTAFACVFCCNVAQFGEDEARRLDRFVRQGGGLVLFLGDRVQPAAYNRVLGAEGPTAPTVATAIKPIFRLASTSANDPASSALLPVTIEPAISQPSYRVDPKGYAHPLAAPFRGRERAGLLTTPVMRYFPLRLGKLSPTRDASTSSAVIAMELDRGDPLIVTSDHGRGRVAVVATAASFASIDPATGGPWTAWPAWPSFLPIINGLLEYSSGGASADPGLLVGDPLIQPASQEPNATAMPPIIETPTGEKAEALLTSEGGWRFTGTDEPGVYRLGSADAAALSHRFAVNTSAVESSLSRIDPRSLPATLSVLTTDDWNGAHDSTAAQTPLHRLLLYAALTLAILETVLACQFGRRSA
ncbi:hypothetical protein Pla111_25130 [Botrimarina hoheduenensis]|uniref:VWFA domain-containing protein n=2 Tax=Botrimarina hoheduenensis TaxID=2528000 RepID=A0A5C5VXZ9_9BACT|nr:hypothetical protein Pla111_25130 [Botrimarina hoheduenensis]